MIRLRFTVCAVLVFGLALVAPAAVLMAQDEAAEEEVELLPPDYVSPEYCFGIALPEGYVAVDYDADGTWVLEIVGEVDQAPARISAEPLAEDVTDVGDFWQLMKDRDPLMERSITYEMVTTVDDSPAVLARIERIERGEYILAITWVFVHEGYGFTLSGYPAPGQDYNTAREIGLQTKEQFRWMTQEEIAEFEQEEPELPAGEEF